MHHSPRSVTSSRRFPPLLAVLGFAALLASGLAQSDERSTVERAALPEGAIEHVMVINLENENFAATFGPSSPAVYLNGTLLKQGQLVTNYFATSHVSLGNYIHRGIRWA